jgi:hypothetical protein
MSGTPGYHIIGGASFFLLLLSAVVLLVSFVWDFGWRIPFTIGFSSLLVFGGCVVYESIAAVAEYKKKEKKGMSDEESLIP